MIKSFPFTKSFYLNTNEWIINLTNFNFFVKNPVYKGTIYQTKNCSRQRWIKRRITKNANFRLEGKRLRQEQCVWCARPRTRGEWHMRLRSFRSSFPFLRQGIWSKTEEKQEDVELQKQTQTNAKAKGFNENPLLKFFFRQLYDGKYDELSVSSGFALSEVLLRWKCIEIYPFRRTKKTKFQTSLFAWFLFLNICWESSMANQPEGEKERRHVRKFPPSTSRKVNKFRSTGTLPSLCGSKKSLHFCLCNMRL